MYDAAARPVLTPFQVASIRVLSAALFLLPFSISAYKRIPGQSRAYVFLSGLLGSFLPAFLFCIAETKIESALTAMLNTLTPIFTLLAAAIVYKRKIASGHVLGVVTGFIGCLLLFASKSSGTPGDLVYAGFVILATICYGLNVNLVRQRLAHINSMDIAACAFTAFIIPSVLVLFFTGYYRLPLTNEVYLGATFAAVLLGVLGTAVASVIFYMLVKMAGSIFASLVTYGIPFVAILWGIFYNEHITLLQVGALLIILFGVYIASSSVSIPGIKRKEKSREFSEQGK